MTKTHSVNLSFEEKDYKALVELADREDRKINAQARHMLRGLLHPEPSWPPALRERVAASTSDAFLDPKVPTSDNLLRIPHA